MLPPIQQAICGVLAKIFAPLRTVQCRSVVAAPFQNVDDILFSMIAAAALSAILAAFMKSERFFVVLLKENSENTEELEQGEESK